MSRTAENTVSMPTCVENARIRAPHLDPGVTQLADCTLPTQFGRFRMQAYEAVGVSTEFICLSKGDVAESQPPLVRLHSECLTGDVLGSLRCDCGEQLHASLDMISAEGCGILMYLRQEGRGIGLVNKLRAYGLQDGGLDTIDANLALGLPVDSREYASATRVLRHLGLQKVRLITNNLSKLEALQECGIEVIERVPIEVPPNPSNLGYLRTKVQRMGHLMDLNGVIEQEESGT